MVLRSKCMIEWVIFWKKTNLKGTIYTIMFFLASLSFCGENMSRLWGIIGNAHMQNFSHLRGRYGVRDLLNKRSKLYTVSVQCTLDTRNSGSWYDGVLIPNSHLFNGLSGKIYRDFNEWMVFCIGTHILNIVQFWWELAPTGFLNFQIAAHRKIIWKF